MKAFVLGLILLLTVAHGANLRNSIQEAPASTDPTHSLWTGNDDNIRMSIENTAIPLPPPESQDDSASPDDKLAYKLAYYYMKMFEILDKDVDSLLRKDDLTSAFVQYKWPTMDSMSVDELVTEMITSADNNGDQKLDLVEFCQFMEALWKVESFSTKMACMARITSAMGTFENLFNWLDIEKTGLDSKSIKFGLSRAIMRDLSDHEVSAIMQNGDTDSDGKLSQAEFLIAVVNGHLTPALTGTS